MADASDLRRLALQLEGTIEAPHFDRYAFKARRIFVTLAPDGLSANFMFSPDEQHFKCLLAPEIFSALPNKWGEKGATSAILANMTEGDLTDALRIAWMRASAKPPRLPNRRAASAGERVHTRK